MKNLSAFIVSVLFAFGLLAFVQAQPAAATNCGPFAAPAFDCVSVNDFTSSGEVSGWTKRDNQITSTYVPSVVLTNTAQCWICWPPGSTYIVTSTASGVMQISYPYFDLYGDIQNSPIQLSKALTLTTGRYKIAVRAASNVESGIELNAAFAYSNLLEQTINSPTNFTAAYGRAFDSNGQEWIISDEIYLPYDAPGYLRVSVGSVNQQDRLYIDALYAVKTGGATALPNGTATPRPIATQLPPATPYCVGSYDLPTATPQIPLYGTPIPTSTPVPISANEFAIVDVFAGGIGDQWQRLPGTADDELIWSSQYNFTSSAYHESEWGSTGGRAPGSALLTYSDPYSSTSTRPGLVFNFANPPTNTVYLDGWAQAGDLLAGQRAYVEVYKQDVGQITFTQVISFEIGAGGWYPYHATFTAAPGGLQALILVVSRSDGARVRGVYLDDQYLYNTIAAAPACNGLYGTFISRMLAISQIGGGLPFYVISVRSDKPCPAEIREPNNFWGPLIGGVTVWLDDMLGMAAGHIRGSLNAGVQTFLLSPLGLIFVYLSILFDWGYVINAVLLVLSIEAAVQILLIIRIIKFTVPGA